MENLWQRKLGSFWRQPYPPPPPPPLVASSLLDSLAQLSSADCRLYMQLLQEPMPLTGGVAQGQMLSNMHGLENLGPTELGASFLSLISGPMAHVPCDQQHLLDPTTIPVSNVLPPIRRTAHVFSGESRVPILPGVSWPHNMDRPNVSPREIFLPYTPPSINVNCNDSEVLQAASLYVRKSQTVSYQNPLEKDNVNCFYPSVGCNSSSRKLEKYPHITASNSFPRVSCYGMSGSLLLSDTGLLGVVCTCHGLYMSISKFSEHSGACDVDPGNAVCMDGGETVAHWWKAFSSRTKIRVLERHRGWDWPEEISVASSLTNHPVSSLSNNPILLNQVGSFSASASHEKKNYSVMDSKHNHSCRNIVDEYLCHGRDSPSRECSNSVSKCFMNNSHENLPYAVGQQIRGQPNSFYVHSEKASKSVAPTPHIICENENALPALPNLQDLKSSCNGFSDGTNNNFCVERPGVPSSIELRLGQPPEKSLTSDAKHQLSMGSKLNGAHEEPSTVFFQDKLPQTSNVWQGIGLTLQYADMYSSPIERRGPAELDHSRDGGGAYGTTTICCKDSPNISLEATNINSKLLPFFRNLDMKCQFRNIYENSIDRHAGEQMRYESNASERHRIYLPWNSLAGTVKECGMDVPTAPSNMNGDEEVECALNGLVGEAKLNDEVPREFNGNARRSNLVFGENSTDFQVKSLDSHYRSGTAKRLLQSKLNTNCSFLKETAKSFHKAEKRAESCSFQWRDVPKNGTGNHSLAKKEQEAVSCSPLMCPSADIATFFAGFAPTVVPLKEHEVFNISSRCSAPDVTQSSSEVNKKDSSTTEVKNASFADSLVVDKGSGNVRSCSSDDAIDSELYGSGSKISLIKREPFELVPRKQSLSLIEEIRLQNSLQSKMIPQKIKRSYTFHEDSESLQKFELTSTKKRKTIKWMKLDVSGHSSIHNRSIKCFEEVGQNSNSFSDMQMKIKCDRGRPRYCADSVEKSDKQRNSAFSVAKWVSHGKDFKEFYHREEQKQTNAHNISVVDYALRASKMFRKKRLRSNDASARPTEVGEKHCSAKLTENLTSEAGSSKTLKKVRPTVCGMYGIISNGNPSKSTKIIPLSVVLRTAGSLADKSNRKTDNYKKLKSTTVKEKNMSVRHVDDTALGKKVPKSRLRKCGTHSSQPIELESSVWNDELDTASCSETNGSDCPSYALQKCSNHGITDRKPEDNLKTKFKEGRKRSLYELLFKGNCSEVVSSSFMKNSSVCKTAGRCCKEVMEIAMDSRAQTSETSKAVRCSVKHLPENSDMFCCVCGGSDKDERNQLLQCNRFLLKGLQDEAEAVCNENVSFCQRCIPHATSHMRIPDSDSGYLQPGEKVSCARTEGYKGRKREGFLHNNSRDTNRSGGCLIPQEQLNAWLHIHRQRPQRKDRPKLSTCIVESDCRKAYTRYKQSKNWKHLVVYKSGIHALGLYTSQFIFQGAMVVEYVGEIVGLRVADRRESEYHAGKKLQHKSACYFFRIDKENIIDATRKGGIARFVNHSCQPNCVAKVISVRTEKKVVFFAERDIYPGEEITYDYHFNHEDEGEKIPCYCNSRNCRRYLN